MLTRLLAMAFQRAEPRCARVFRRHADLARHKMCDYRRCSRHEQPLFGQDHFRDHVHNQHNDDLWWQPRNRATVLDGW